MTHLLKLVDRMCKAGFILFDFINARIRAYAPRWATPRANIAPRRCVVNHKYEHTRAYACKLPWRLYPFIERDPRKRIWLDEISTPALKVQLGWTLRRTYARRIVRWEYERFSVCARMCPHTRARSMNPALIWNRSSKHYGRYRADTICSTDGQTDGWTDGQTDRRTNKVKSVYPRMQLHWWRA